MPSEPRPPATIIKRLSLALACCIFVTLAITFFISSRVINSFIDDTFDNRIRICLGDLKALSFDAPLAALRDGTAMDDSLCQELGGAYDWQISIQTPGKPPLLLGNPALPQLAASLRDASIARLTHKDEKLRLTRDSYNHHGTQIWTLTVAVKEELILAEKIKLGHRRGLIWLTGALLLLPLSLLAVVWAQRPLARLRGEIDALDSGTLSRLSAHHGPDLSPVAARINHLIASYQKLVDTSRARADILAHNVRGSLSSLTYELERMQGRFGPQPSIEDLRARTRDILRHIEQQVSETHQPALPAQLAEAADPESVAGQIVSALQRLYADRELEWEVGAGGPCKVACSEGVLGEILFNILDNAGKWARSHVSCHWQPAPEQDMDGQPRGMILIQVADDGPGFAPESAPPTAPDSPAAGAHTPAHMPAHMPENAQGLGLGYALAQRLARLHGGDISRAHAPGGGALVKILLPCMYLSRASKKSY